MKALVLSLWIGTILCTLEVYEPKDAKETYGGITIGYTVANFGHIPYGKSIVGDIIVASPLENC